MYYSTPSSKPALTTAFFVHYKKLNTVSWTQARGKLKKPELEPEPVLEEEETQDIVPQFPYDSELKLEWNGPGNILPYKATSVFMRIAAMESENEHGASRDSVLRVYDSDPAVFARLFERLDGDGDGCVSPLEWHRYLRWARASKHINGNAWLEELLGTLESNLDAIEADTQKQQRKAAQGEVFQDMVGLAETMTENWHTLSRECTAVFLRIATNTDDIAGIDKLHIEMAFMGDDSVFDDMDTNHDGIVSQAEWHKFLKEGVEARGAEGDGWLKDLLQVMNDNLDDAQAEHENAMNTIPYGKPADKNGDCDSESDSCTKEAPAAEETRAAKEGAAADVPEAGKGAPDGA